QYALLASAMSGLAGMPRSPTAAAAPRAAKRRLTSCWVLPAAPWRQSPFAALKPLDDRPRAEPAAAAHRNQPVAAAGSLQLVQRGGDQPGAGAARRMTERDGAAIRVDARGIGLARLLPGQYHRGECFVHLEDAHVLHGEPTVLQNFPRRRDRA